MAAPTLTRSLNHKEASIWAGNHSEGQAVLVGKGWSRAARLGGLAVRTRLGHGMTVVPCRPQRPDGRRRWRRWR